MKVHKTGYANPTSQVSGATRPPRAAAADAAPAEAAAPLDQTTLAGIPEAELTPKVRAAIDQLMAEVQLLRDELAQARQRVDHLEQLADQDTLTPVLNRRAFIRELTRLMAFIERYGGSSAVLFFDVDELKQINDTHGHAAGDAALSHVADVLTQNVRGSDLVGRLGGDEFGVILAQADPEEAQAKAASLAAAILSQPLPWQGHEIVVRASFGVQPLSPGQQVDDALDAADRAMYVQKTTRQPKPTE